MTLVHFFIILFITHFLMINTPDTIPLGENIDNNNFI